MKKYLITLILFFILATGFSQIIEPIKEPSLVTFKELPGDTFAIINIQRMKNVNEKIVYMYELICVKDSLESIVDQYAALTKTKNEIITLQQKRINSLEDLYKASKDLLMTADGIISKQQTKIKQKNKIITALSVSTGASVLLLIAALFFK